VIKVSEITIPTKFTLEYILERTNYSNVPFVINVSMITKVYRDTNREHMKQCITVVVIVGEHLFRLSIYRSTKRFIHRWEENPINVTHVETVIIGRVVYRNMRRDIKN
jgi:hypothetical protein